MCKGVDPSGHYSIRETLCFDRNRSSDWYKCANSRSSVWSSTSLFLSFWCLSFFYETRSFRSPIGGNKLIMVSVWLCSFSTWWWVRSIRVRKSMVIVDGLLGVSKHTKVSWVQEQGFLFYFLQFKLFVGYSWCRSIRSLNFLNEVVRIFLNFTLVVHRVQFSHTLYGYATEIWGCMSFTGLWIRLGQWGKCQGSSRYPGGRVWKIWVSFNLNLSSSIFWYVDIHWRIESWSSVFFLRIEIILRIGSIKSTLILDGQWVKGGWNTFLKRIDYLVFRDLLGFEFGWVWTSSTWP